MAKSIQNKITLNDKYTLNTGKIFVTGSQALVKIPMLMHDFDKKNGKNTAGFISGYRGSPLARLDQQLWNAQTFLDEKHIKFTPGINEDLGATAVWGSQHTSLFEGAKYDGVFGVWYGKGPGVDRSMDVLKHANAAGTSINGGVLALAGDDHTCDSSTLAHQSEQDFISAMIPVLHPATVEEYLDYGILGIEMSRYAGCWVAMKCVTEVVESSASINVDIDKFSIKAPNDYTFPKGGLSMRRPDDRFEQEHRLYEKLEAAKAFARANGIDNIKVAGKKAKIGILTTGKSYTDTMQALQDLGLNEKDIEKAGLRIYKVGLVWPIEPIKLKEFANGLNEILVIEEKRGILEGQLKQYLYDWKMQVKITGKKDNNSENTWQFKAAGEVTPLQIANVLAEKIKIPKQGVLYLKEAKEQEKSTKLQGVNVLRMPYYCSGCPHNLSTKVPTGSRAMVGIGCHFMVQWMDRSSEIFSHMGGEGVTWVGQSPFTTEKHIFMNLGDGTYYHSGSLAIRAAVASGVNITYKILYNDAVAMTGGQPVEGKLTVPQISRQMAAEGVEKIIIVAEDPKRYAKMKNDSIAQNVKVYHRSKLEQVQKEMREIEGCSILIYDQTCAAEKRRMRKRGQFPDPDKRAFINDAICEDCGDCSAKSNCVSIEPLETELGRKRTINQSSCNKDFSCINGFCPSFVTVNHGKIKRLKVTGNNTNKDLPLPKNISLEKPYDIIVTGIGGTGVITIGAVLGMAAHLEGKGVKVLDQTGLAQKNGAVVSYLRIAKNSNELHSPRTVTAGADLLLGCDKIVSSNSKVLEKISNSKTKGVINNHLTPTAGFTLDTESTINEIEIAAKIAENFAVNNLKNVDATRIATALMGDSIATNMFMLGYAFQQGLIPLSLESIHNAIELNGVAIKGNKHALYWGRLMAIKPESVLKIAAPVLEATAPEKIAETLEDIIEYRKNYLVKYQNNAYAERYIKLINGVQQVAGDNNPELTEAVARNAFKVMSYKDEYEVGRLYTNGDFKKKLAKQFDGEYNLSFHLAPPLFARKDANGHLKKIEIGGWIMPAFKMLAYMKFLRATPLDIFGYTAERKMERNLITDYFNDIKTICGGLTVHNHKLAVDIANLPSKVKGFGHIKESNFANMKQSRKILLTAFNNPIIDAVQEASSRLKVEITGAGE